MSGQAVELLSRLFVRLVCLRNACAVPRRKESYCRNSDHVKLVKSGETLQRNASRNATKPRPMCLDMNPASGRVASITQGHVVSSGMVMPVASCIRRYLAYLQAQMSAYDKPAWSQWC